MSEHESLTQSKRLCVMNAVQAATLPRLLFILGTDPQMYAVITTPNVPPHSPTEKLLSRFAASGVQTYPTMMNKESVSTCICVSVRVCVSACVLVREK